jgi:signal transduction histidine kinase
MMLRRKHDSSATPPSDLSVVQRAGRIAAMQASLALAAVLLVVGVVVFAVDVRVQDRQIASQLQQAASTADDVTDPPPGMELVMQTKDGLVSTSDEGKPGIRLLAGPTGFSDIEADGQHYRALVRDRPDVRVVAMLDLAPFHGGRDRLMVSLGLAELAGILASTAVVVLLTRRSVRPLAQALALQRRFVADASHELRAPLTVLHTRAQMLARHAAAAGAAKFQAEAEALVTDTRVLGDIVDDLLASATMTAGATLQDRVDLVSVAGDVRDSMADYAQSIGVAITLNVQGPAEAEVIGSEVALRRAMTSLIDNALAHEHPGGTIALRVMRSGKYVRVTVSDDGAGIEPETVPTLFTRFASGASRAGRAGREPHGIGLALVREIVQAHGGNVIVESSPGEGATFTLTLPAADGYRDDDPSSTKPVQTGAP